MGNSTMLVKANDIQLLVMNQEMARGHWEFQSFWVNALAKQVESVDVITIREYQPRLENNVHVHSLGKEKGYGRLRKLIEFYRHLAKILRGKQITACLVFHAPIYTVLAAPFCKLLGVPIITWYAHRHANPTMKMAYHLSDVVLTSYLGAYPYKKDKVLSIGQGIDTELFRPSTQPVWPDPPIILHVGRLSPIKRLEVLMGAVATLRSEGRDVRLMLVGKAPERDRAYHDRLLQESERLGLKSFTTLTGAMSPEETVHWYQRCSAHVNCSYADGALDKAVSECMACSKPSLSSTQGFREVMGSYADRLIFRDNDPVDLAEKLRVILDTPVSQLQKLGEDLRARVENMCSLANWTRTVLTVVEKVRDKRAGSTAS